MQGWLPDANGNTTDANGNVYASYTYDAWGNVLSQSGTVASENPYQYAGYRYDDTTGLYYMMSRTYPTVAGAAWVALDLISTAIPVGSISLVAHAAKELVQMAHELDAVREVGTVDRLATKGAQEGSHAGDGSRKP